MYSVSKINIHKKNRKMQVTNGGILKKLTLHNGRANLCPAS
jgi:hypothetical protein